jgi:hypothetical protein
VANLSELGSSEGREFATPFPVQGREAFTKICEFQRDNADWEFKQGEYQIALDAKFGFPSRWSQLVEFPLKIDGSQVATLRSNHIVHDNLID